jgi:hypothetical protein
MVDPTVYVNDPEDLYDAWASLGRLLDHLGDLFFLIATVTSPDNQTPNEEKAANVIFGTALVGHELAVEAGERAETLFKFAKRQSAKQKPDADTTQTGKEG